MLVADSATAQLLDQFTLVVPYSAGSAQDIGARLIAERYGPMTNRQLIVHNKPGAAGTIASAWVAASKPDGQKLLFAASSHHFAGALHSRLSYHPLHSFRGVAFLGHSEYVLVVSDSLQLSDLPSFVNRVKAQPNDFNFASSGHGSITHVGMAAFMARAGLRMAHIPMKGSSEILQELLAGRIHAALVSPLSLLTLKSDVRIRALAVTSLQRSDHFPDLPTVAESGYAGFQWMSWTGLLAPRDTPNSVVHAINQAMNTILTIPVLQQRLQSMGVVTRYLKPSQFDSLLQADWKAALQLTSQLQLSLD